ncbi:hypothetical protein os4_36860 (plasmid) [Comamonadaceae bacterium OS-4]|nr:hypothetical protein os4_36860 [Comamonadaceae bacterium OS-4]
MLKLLDKKTGTPISEHDLLPEPSKAGFVIVYGTVGTGYQEVCESAFTAANFSHRFWKSFNRESNLEQHNAWLMSEVNYGESGRISDDETAAQLTAMCDLLHAGMQVFACIHATDPIVRLEAIASNVHMSSDFFKRFKDILMMVGRREICMQSGGNVTVTDYLPV